MIEITKATPDPASSRTGARSTPLSTGRESRRSRSSIMIKRPCWPMCDRGSTARAIPRPTSERDIAIRVARPVIGSSDVGRSSGRRDRRDLWGQRQTMSISLSGTAPTSPISQTTGKAHCCPAAAGSWFCLSVAPDSARSLTSPLVCQSAWSSKASQDCGALVPGPLEGGHPSPSRRSARHPHRLPAADSRGRGRYSELVADGRRAPLSPRSGRRRERPRSWPRRAGSPSTRRVRR